MSSGHDAELQRSFLRTLPAGTAQGLEELTSHEFWNYVMKQAEIEVSNEDLFRFRFSDVGSCVASRLAFLAGSGEFTTFNARYLINNIVDQAAEMHRYTRKLEKYCVKLQQRLEQTQQQQQQAEPQHKQSGGAEPQPGPGGKQQQQLQPEQQQQAQQQLHAPTDPQKRELRGRSSSDDDSMA